jgi:exosortase
VTEDSLNHAGQNPALEGLAQPTLARRTRWLQATILVVLIGFLYHDVLLLLVRDWMHDDNYSHGFFVPLFSAYVLWLRRKRLSAMPAVPSWQGLLIIVGALATLIVGVLGAELFLSRSSLVLLLAGLIIYFLGWGWFRVVLFPWAFLFLMIPIPQIIFNQITLPLQFLASRLGSWLLALLGVPVLREGNIIHLPVMDLEVVEACSGIRSLVSLVTLAIMYGYFLEPRIWLRIFLALTAVPIAVAANGLRVMGTGLLAQYSSPDKAEGFFHSFAGWVIFLLSLGMLFGLHGGIRWLGRWGRAREL